ncbi:hypothetical protein POM88_011264 [Heracleum sosnowskyi]|uniref:F-box domain-containing protein n=1 Tax=Heracleum sosnowskyi TaxID=360622 RepID=A0AAD8N299_9APIA|nr:hypothetical protein POM88_011264 [Heracleum sosnowskyi]
MATKRPEAGRYFPEEVIFKILSWTKGTSLFRFKFVCKLWHSIIIDNKFIESHHTNSLKNPSILLITNVEKKGYHNCSAASLVYGSSGKGFVDLHLPSPFDGMEFVSSSNGIVCLYESNIGDDIYLLNPLTRMSKRLPIIFIRHAQPPYNPYYNSVQRKVYVAFGFDCVSHDFKVLKITYLLERDSRYMNLLSVYLYTLNANSWREIEIDSTTLPKIGWFSSCPILVHGPIVDGVLHLKGINKIVTFDLHTEIFGLIPFWRFMQESKLHDKSHVLEFKGSVAMIFESNGEGSIRKDTSLWTVEVVFGEVFWNKVLTFNTSWKIDWVFLYSSGQFVGQTDCGEVLLYDYRKKKETKYIGVSSESLVRVFEHMESFLSIEGLEYAEEKQL